MAVFQRMALFSSLVVIGLTGASNDVADAADSGWLNYIDNPIKSPDASHPKLEEPEILYENGGFTLWHLGFESHKYYHVYRERSSDGINFAYNPSDKPVLKDVLRFNITKIDGVYYGFGRKAPNGRYSDYLDIYGWQSNNGITWKTMNDGMPIILHGAQGAWDYRLENCTFTRHNGIWKVLYDGAAVDFGLNQIGYAEGASFPLKKTSRPIIAPNRYWMKSLSTSSQIGTPKLIELPGGTNLLFVCGTGTSGDFNLGALTSRSLKGPWTDLPCNPILPSVAGKMQADPAVCYDQVSGFLWMYYGYDAGGGTLINLARFEGTWSDFFQQVRNPHQEDTAMPR